MKIENRSRKRSHNLEEIGVGRIRTFPFPPIPFTIPSLMSQWKPGYWLYLPFKYTAIDSGSVLFFDFWFFPFIFSLFLAIQKNYCFVFILLRSPYAHVPYHNWTSTTYVSVNSILSLVPFAAVFWDVTQHSKNCRLRRKLFEVYI